MQKEGVRGEGAGRGGFGSKGAENRKVLEKSWGEENQGSRVAG